MPWNFVTKHLQRPKETATSSSTFWWSFTTAKAYVSTNSLYCAYYCQCHRPTSRHPLTRWTRAVVLSVQSAANEIPDFFAQKPSQWCHSTSPRFVPHMLFFHFLIKNVLRPHLCSMFYSCMTYVILFKDCKMKKQIWFNTFYKTFIIYVQKIIKNYIVKIIKGTVSLSFSAHTHTYIKLVF